MASGVEFNFTMPWYADISKLEEKAQVGLNRVADEVLKRSEPYVPILTHATMNSLKSLHETQTSDEMTSEVQSLNWDNWFPEGRYFTTDSPNEQNRDKHHWFERSAENNSDVYKKIMEEALYE